MTKRTKRIIAKIIRTTMLVLACVTALVGLYLLTAVFGPNEEVNILPGLGAIACLGFTAFIAKAAYGEI